MKLAAAFIPALILFLAWSCASLPSKRVDTLLSGAVAGDLGAELAEVRVSAGPAVYDVETVVRELFPMAAAQAGIRPSPGAGRAEYEIWLREAGYARDLDERSAILCVLRLRSKKDGTVLATAVVSEDAALDLRSSGFLYGLLREALASMAKAIAEAERDAQAGEP